eukprot:TRINITY_DN7251_c1_g1_i5.p1 TRINITY_DN7251_c1_g1~~TRINITY_DN7251_c1_g1_i5.p1  ORF type:complete len:612 (-),score=120.12 TRINITY_DN7251_c1_g1_i5:426-2261(-)
MKLNYGAISGAVLILLIRSLLVVSQESQMQPQVVSSLNGTGCAWNSTKIGGSMARVENCNNTSEIKFSNFTFALPNNSVILGIEITVNATILAEACEILQIETPTAKSQQLTFCNTSLYNRNFGGSNVTWNITNLHYDAINSPVFGFEYWISSNKSHNTSVDSVSLTVYYNATTPPSSTTSAPGSSSSEGSGSSNTASNTGSSTGPSSETSSPTNGTISPSNSRTSSSTAATTSDQTNAILSSSGLISSTLLIIILASILGGLLIILIIVIIIFAVYRSKQRSMGAMHEPIFDDRPSRDIIIEMKPPPVPPLVLADLVVPIHSFQERIQKLSQPLPNPHNRLTGFQQEFMYIESVTDPATSDKSKFVVALLPGNSSRNRYQNILAQDVTRVKLLGQEDEAQSDYINANYISGQIPGTEKAYIATQGPVMEHADTFWRMVWHENCSIVLMLTRVVEGNKIKCDVYWAEEEQPVSTDSFDVILLSSHQKDEGLTVRDLKITDKKSGESKRVKQFQYTVWPDHGVPASTAVFLELSHMADQANTSHGPLIVHCRSFIHPSSFISTIMDVSSHAMMPSLNLGFPTFFSIFLNRFFPFASWLIASFHSFTMQCTIP